MKKITILIAFSFFFCIVLTSCREQKEVKEKDNLEKAADEIEEGAERAKEEVEGAYDDVKEELDGETDDN